MAIDKDKPFGLYNIQVMLKVLLFLVNEMCFPVILVLIIKKKIFLIQKRMNKLISLITA